MPVSFSALLDVLDPQHFQKGEVESFTSLAIHSGSVTPGSLFCAIRGLEGQKFIEEALQRGASGLLVPAFDYERICAQFPTLTCLGISDIRLAVAQAAALFHPGTLLTLALVTGTNGKTSIAHLTRQLWGALGQKAVSMGTLGVMGENRTLPDLCQEGGALTTPDPLFLHRCLQALVKGGWTHGVLEASSHGLDQKRLHGLRCDVAVWTHLSRDHLDYHPDMAAYWAAKNRLFTDLLKPGGVALLNTDLPRLDELIRECRGREQVVWTYGKGGDPLNLLKAKVEGDTQHLTCDLWGQRHVITLPLPGVFQAENFLASVGILCATGTPLSDILPHVSQLTAPPGRLEWIRQTPQGGDVYVDFAHTPDALKIALQNLRAHTKGRLHLVFGCGGDRDPGKRVEMGQIARTYADSVIITDDNPRTEPPAIIRAAIQKGCPKAQNIGDRRTAIHTAMDSLRPGDTLLIAGKGHELTQITAAGPQVFRDADVVGVWG